MSYRDIKSTRATIKSYMEALKKLTDLCPYVEPSANEFNQRTPLPTIWTPTLAVDYNILLQHCTTITPHHEDLFDFSQPKLIQKGWWVWDDRFFVVYCAIHFPFFIYAWEEGHYHYPEGYDGNNEPIGEQVYTPPKMTEWCSPQYLTLVVYDGHWGKAWGLKDWHTKAEEIATFCNGVILETAKQDYIKGIEAANKEVEKWEKAIAQIGKVKIPNASH